MSVPASSALRHLIAVVSLVSALVPGCAHDDTLDPSACELDPCGCDEACEHVDAATYGVSHAQALPDGRIAAVTFDAARDALVVVIQRQGAAVRTVHVVASPVAPDAARWARLAVGPSGALHVVWVDAARPAVLWTRDDREGERVHFAAPEVVTSIAASRLALEVDASGRPYLAFRDDEARSVRFATRQGSGWTLTRIQGCAAEADCPSDGEDYGQALDLALIPSGDAGALPRIAFYDALRGDLKLASRDAAGVWTTVTLDGRHDGVDSGDVGRFVSLAVTPTRSLGVAYFDASYGALRYLGPAAAPRVVDSGLDPLPDGRTRSSIVGQMCTLAYDSRGAAHVIYVDGTAPGLRHARIPGDGSPTVTPLAIPAGSRPWFEVVGDRLVGAYAAFTPGDAPRTSARFFDLSAQAGTP